MKTLKTQTRTHLTLAGLALVGAALVHGPARAEEPVTISLLSAPFGTSSYVMGSALEEISKKANAGVRVTHSESPGFVFNITKLDKEPELKKNTIVGSGGGVLGLATKGEAPFKQKYPPLKLIANYNLNSSWLATLNDKIKTVEDLKGKKVALGRRAQINWAIQPATIIYDGYGIGKNDIDIQYVGTKEAVDALLDGTVDAAVVGGYVDPINNKMVLSPQTTEFIASGRKAYQLNWGADKVKKAASVVSMENVTIPAGLLPGQDKPLQGFADTVAWMAAPEFPDDVAYKLTKMIIENIKSFGDYHATGKLMSPEGLVFGWKVEDIHPGALRAYKEAGIIK